MTAEVQPRVLVVGLGLIGASLAKGLRLSQSAYVVGADAAPGVVDRACDLGIIDAAADLDDPQLSFDVLVLAVPVLAMRSVLAQLKPRFTARTVITDVGSVKGVVIESAQSELGTLPPGFVPGHPIAGAERSGVDAAKADLFDRKMLILTPLPSSSAEAVDTLSRLWQSVGADVVTMPPGRHDEVLAATSHLPHLLAFSLVDTLSRESENREIFRYAAGGFRDFTRIAASDPTMWHDIFMANRTATLDILHKFQADLQVLSEAIEQRQGEVLKTVFGRAKSSRDYFTQILKSRQRHTDDVRKNLIAAPAHAGLAGTLSVPGDKSISHRAIILAALAEGDSQLRGFGEGDANRTTLEALRKLGVEIKQTDTLVQVRGRGLTGLTAADSPLYLGGSGTSMRLLCGVLAAQSFACELIGDASLCQRPMDRIQAPLMAMGANVELAADGTAPIQIRPVTRLETIDYDMPMASAQVKSTILLAALCAGVPLTLTEPGMSRDHTEHLLADLGCRVSREDGRLRFGPVASLPPLNMDIPGDFSLAAFHIAAASLIPDSDIVLEGVGVNPTRTGFLDVLIDMGGQVDVFNRSTRGGEPTADLRVRYARLKAGRFGKELTGRTIDEFPVLFVLATQAEGETRFEGVHELRYKETDRLQRMIEGLTTLGAEIRLEGDTVFVEGRACQRLSGGIVDSAGDHRVALALMIAAQRASRPVIIRNSGRVLGAYPGFSEHMNTLGYSVTVED